jgi:hypothetical protein
MNAGKQNEDLQSKAAPRTSSKVNANPSGSIEFPEEGAENSSDVHPQGGIEVLPDDTSSPQGDGADTVGMRYDGPGFSR